MTRLPSGTASESSAPELPEAAVADGWPLAEVVARLRRALRSSVRSDIAWERLPMAQVELLQRLAEEPGLRVKDLADRHRLATNTVSNLVQHMVEAGLVERRSDPADRRAVVLMPTLSGQDNLRAWLVENSRRLQAALDELAKKDRVAILAVVPALVRLVERLEETDHAGDNPRESGRVRP